VVKPLDGNRGRGVMLNLMTERDIHTAWHTARAESDEVIVEQFITGDEHRILVVDGRVVAACRGEASWVIGDGQHAMQALIDLQINSDPRRGLTDKHPLETIHIDLHSVVRANIERQGLQANSVPEKGRRVLITANGNHAIECTEAVHPEVAHACALAARVVGLDIAGIDLVCADVSQPLQQQGGAIVEVNAGPSLLMHLNPAQGTPQPVGDAIVGGLFPGEEDGRVPIVGVAGTRDTTLIAQLVAWLLQLSGLQAGLACRDGLFVGSRHLESADAVRWEAGRRLLINRNVEAAVFENDPLSLLTEGLAYDRCDIGIVTDCEGLPALEEHLMSEPKQRFKIMRTQVDVVLKTGAAVLHAVDELVMEMAELCDGEVVLYAVDNSLAALAAHRDQGGRVVFMQGDVIMQAHGDQMYSLIDLAKNQRVAARMLPETVMLASVAAAWAMGLTSETIITGLETFEPAQSRKLHIAA
jgi:cyanophycin synthetase